MNEGRIILVTGGAGYVGSNLCRQLCDSGFTVISLDNYFNGFTENHYSGVKYIEGDVRNISELVSDKPEIVFHLGEYARVEQSFDDIELVWKFNRAGMTEVLEFCRHNGCKLVYAGSSTKFGDEGKGPTQSPYAWSKATNTELVKCYGDWFGLDYAITYFYNVYGRNEISSGRYATVIGLFSERFRMGLPLTVVSPGTQVRNFTHIDDIVAGLMLVGDRGLGDGFGIGCQESFSVLEVAKMFGGDIEFLPERPGNRLTASLMTEKTQALGWYSKHHLRDYIQRLREMK
jgi:UDP-glucose 4-epimerase